MVDREKDYRPVLQANAARFFIVTINGATRGAHAPRRRLPRAHRVVSYGIPGDAREHLQRSITLWRSWKPELAGKK